MGFKELVNEDLRLAMLRCLEESGSYSLNDSILQAFLERVGHKHGRDKIKTEMHWLAEQDLVTLGGIETVLVATLTNRGLDVATGRTTVPGVKRPSPRQN